MTEPRLSVRSAKASDIARRLALREGCTIADIVELRYVPNLRIEADTSFDYAEQIGKRLDQVADERDEDEG